MSVKLEIVFNDIGEAARFLSFVPAVQKSQFPQQALPQQAPAAVNPMPAQVTQTAPQLEDPIKALREAAASLIARMPAGEGPKKVRELLMAQGIAKFADANPQQATTLAAQMNAA